MLSRSEGSRRVLGFGPERPKRPPSARAVARHLDRSAATA